MAFPYLKLFSRLNVKSESWYTSLSYAESLQAFQLYFELLIDGDDQPQGLSVFLRYLAHHTFSCQEH